MQTLQTIAFNAYLREQGYFRPFLVVCPLSVLHNWAEEYQRFAPEVSHFSSLYLEFVVRASRLFTLISSLLMPAHFRGFTLVPSMPTIFSFRHALALVQVI
jgi:SNF2 family DNA or RNA helicase